jgi:RNA polymerase sigma-70 factor, ECF subfamily
MAHVGDLPEGGPGSDVTVLLRRWSDGDAAALDALLPSVQAELQRLARSYMRREREGHTLEPTALVHEAYLRLVDQRDVQWASRGHFFAIAAQAMRRVLVDHARGHLAAKRGGGAERVTLSGVPDIGAVADPEVLALHRALERLAALDPRQARVVELRTFGGLSVEETGAVLGISPATVKREWATARLWLARALTARAGGEKAD